MFLSNAIFLEEDQPSTFTPINVEEEEHDLNLDATKKSTPNTTQYEGETIISAGDNWADNLITPSSNAAFYQDIPYPDSSTADNRDGSICYSSTVTTT